MTNKKTITPFSLRAALALLVAVMTFATARAEQTESWIYNPNTTNNTCIITGSIDSAGGEPEDLKYITIPKQLDGYWVIDVSDNVLTAYTGLTGLYLYEDAQIRHMPKVNSSASFFRVSLLKSNGEVVDNTLPASITDIGNAFMGTGIKSLTMPGVTNIGTRAFEGCNSLQSVTFGQAVNIGTYSNPFQKLSQACTVTYPGPMANWSPYNYQYSPNLVVKCSDGSCGWCGDGWDSEWTDIDNLYKDNSCLFWSLSNDNHLTIDCLDQDIIFDNYFSKQNVRTEYWDRSKVTSITLGGVNEFWGMNCFDFNAQYDKITSVSINQHAKTKNFISGLITNMSDNMLTYVSVDANNLVFDSRDNCNAVIEKATGILLLGCKNTVVPSGVTSIGDNAFQKCQGLTSILLPSSVTSIGKDAFHFCGDLTDLYFDGTKAQWDAVEKGPDWNDGTSYLYKEHWRCTVTFDANGRGTAPVAQTNLWSNEAKLAEPTVSTAGEWRVKGWYTDAACTNKWNFDTDIVRGDMTLYAKWAEPCAVTASTAAASINIPYGQEWTDVAVTLNSLTLGWFQNGTAPVCWADAVAVTPLVGSGASQDLTFYDGAATLTARRGAGAHTNISGLSESLTAQRQSATLWVHIPQSTWESAEAGDYTGTLNYDAVFISNNPEETYAYSLGSGAQVTLNLTIPAAATLTFDANGGTGDAMAAVSGRVGHAMQLPACTYAAPNGKEFLCWNTKADGMGARYYAGSEFTPTDSQTTLYAEWGEGYVIDLTATAVNGSVEIPLGLYGQLTQLTGYFVFNEDNGENVPVGFLDLDRDGVDDLALVNGRDVNDNMTASVKKLTSLTANYRFVLSVPSGEGEYGSLLIKSVADGQAMEQPVIEPLFDDNGTYNREQLLTLKDGHTHSLMLSGRTLYADGDWNTLCLPFAVNSFSGTPLDGFTVMALDTETAYDGHVTGVAGSTLYLNFKAVNAIEAGKPYIVKKAAQTANIVNPVFHGVIVTAATREIANPFHYSYDDPEFITVAAPTDVTFTGGKFCGTYDPTEIYNAGHTKYYLGAQNMLYWPTDEGYTVKAFRAYFDLSDGASNVTTMRLGFGDGSATAVELPLMENGEGSMDNDADAWYDLAGRRLTDRPVTPGIYIVRGRKVVVK